MLANFIRISVNSIAAPKFAELFHSDKIHELENVARKTSKLLSIATLPVAVGLIVFGYHILGAFYGEEFTAGYDALILLVAGQLLSAMVGPVGHLLNMCGREKQCRNILIAGAIINFALNLVLIPIWGITGAAVANMVAVIFNNLCFLFYVKKSFGIFVMYVPFLPKK